MTPEPVRCIRHIVVRFSAQEYALVQAKAALLGLTVAEYMRTCMGYGYPA
jgi:hypothetical protein